jgi:hypothetical protein
MGLLDLPASLWSWTDVRMAALLPASVRLVAWGAAAAILSLGIYWLISPQKRIAQISADEQRLKATLRDETIEMADGLAAAKGLLRLALVRLGLVTMPVLIAALPLLSLMTWMEAHYAYSLPPSGQTADVRVEPPVAQGRWISGDDATPRVEVLDGHGSVLREVPVAIPVPVIEKRFWWNALIGNPLGYLPDDSPFDRINIGLPANEYFSIGPDWARGWVTPFILSLLVGSIFLKFAFRIH